MPTIDSKVNTSKSDLALRVTRLEKHISRKASRNRAGHYPINDIILPLSFAVILLAQLYTVNATTLRAPRAGADEAYRFAAAVFLGEVMEVRQEESQTKAGTNIRYQEVKFRVIKSWKLVDRYEITVHAATAPDEKGGVNFNQGDIYLVYAEQLNDTFYASSRTRILKDAVEDMKVLGVERLVLKPGEFRTHNITLYGTFTCGMLVLILSCYLYRLHKKPFRVVFC